MREELITSAVTFLNDPQVADSTMAKKIEFLESKDLSKDEIAEAIRRAGNTSSSSSPSTVAPASSVPGATGNVPGYGYPVNQSPPPLPRRDWKDYFVMATVTAGVAYGLYEVANRYVLPLIMPPTPQALEADKEALEAEFARTEALLEQIQKDTEELKKAEQERKDKFAQLVTDTEKAVDNVKAQTQQRETDMKLIKSQVESIKESLPNALEKHRQQQDKALIELQDELRSLKQLIANRVKPSASPAVLPVSAVPNSVGRPVASSASSGSPVVSTSSNMNNSNSNDKSTLNSVKSSGNNGGADASNSNGGSGASTPRAGIPAWQLAAAKAKEAEA